MHGMHIQFVICDRGKTNSERNAQVYDVPAMYDQFIRRSKEFDWDVGNSRFV